MEAGMNKVPERVFVDSNSDSPDKTRVVYRQVLEQSRRSAKGSAARLAKVFKPDEDAVVIVCGRCKALFADARKFAAHKAEEFQCLEASQAARMEGNKVLDANAGEVKSFYGKPPMMSSNPENLDVIVQNPLGSDLDLEEVEAEEESHDGTHLHLQPQRFDSNPMSSVLNDNLEQKSSWLSKAEQKSLRKAMSFNEKAPTPDGTATPTPYDSQDWFTEEEREHIPSLLGLGEYIGPGSSWKTPVALRPGTGIVLSGKFLPVGSSRYDKHFSFGLDFWDMTLPFSSSKTRQRALYINPVFATNEIQIGSLINEEFVGVRHLAEAEKFPFRPGGKFTFALLCQDKAFKVWWKGSRGEGGTIYEYQYDVEKIKYLRVYDCHAVYIALGFRFWNS